MLPGDCVLRGKLSSNELSSSDKGSVDANYLNIFLLSSLIIILSSKVPALSPLFLP